jgi:hypothetical protein
LPTVSDFSSRGQKPLWFAGSIPIPICRDVAVEKRQTNHRRKFKERRNTAMGDYDKYLAKKTLELLEDTIIGCQPEKSGPGTHEGFENKDVIRMIKLWEKAIILRLGFSDRDWAVYTSNHEPLNLPKAKSAPRCC